MMIKPYIIRELFGIYSIFGGGPEKGTGGWSIVTTTGRERDWVAAASPRTRPTSRSAGFFNHCQPFGHRQLLFFGIFFLLHGELRYT